MGFISPISYLTPSEEYFFNSFFPGDDLHYSDSKVGTVLLILLHSGPIAYLINLFN